MSTEKMEKEPKEDVELGTQEAESPHVPTAGRISNAGSRRYSLSRSLRNGSARHSSVSASARSLSFFGGSNPFEGGVSSRENDEEELKWAAFEKLPTYNRLRTSVFQKDTGSIRHVDVKNLSTVDFNQLLLKINKVGDEEDEQLLRKVRRRLDQVGIELPTVEVRYENLSIKANCHVGDRGLPTLSNVVRDIVESALDLVKILPSRKQVWPSHPSALFSENFVRLYIFVVSAICKVWAFLCNQLCALCDQAVTILDNV